jgi:predicted PurR-regulated permease PerM
MSTRDEPREGAEDAREDAAEAAEAAEAATSEKESGSWGAVDDHELLMHPDHEPDHDSPHPFGVPGRPVSRRSPFYVGFVGGLGVLTALLLGFAIREISSVLVLIMVSLFLAIGLNPLVEWFMKFGVRRPLAVATVAVGVLGAVALFIVALVPVLRDQIEALIQSVPGWLNDLERNKTVRDLDDKYDIIDQVNEKVQSADFAQTAFGSIYSVGLTVLSALFNAFLVFVMTLYFLGSLPTIKRACYSLAPASRRTRVTYLGDEILRRVGGYVSGAFLVALCAGVSTFLFLEIAGLGRYAVALALVVMILDFIPLVGATIGASIVTVIGFATSIGIGIACLAFFIVYQQTENYVIYPRIMRSSVNVPGLLTVIGVLIGGALLGPIGALLAIPTVAATMLVVREVYVRAQDAA